MFQQCPQCMTLLDVSNEQLANNHGRITCEHCQRVFTATAAVRPIIDGQAQAQLMAEAIQPQAARHHRPLRWGWAILCLFLALLLAGQGTYFKRNELAANSALRPWLQGLCLYLHCELKLLRDLDQLRILAREVRSHPSINNALQINLTIRNEAPFRQPWPTLQLSFSDINNRTIAQRSFKPQDYLPADTQLSDGMPAQVPLHTRLVLIDPGPDAVNFIFDFK